MLGTVTWHLELVNINPLRWLSAMRTFVPADVNLKFGMNWTLVGPKDASEREIEFVQLFSDS